MGRGGSLTPRLVHSLCLCQGIFTSLSLTGSGFQKKAYLLRSVLALQGASDHPDPREHLVPASDSTRNRLTVTRQKYILSVVVVLFRIFAYIFQKIFCTDFVIIN